VDLGGTLGHMELGCIEVQGMVCTGEIVMLGCLPDQ
jgi:hypothetical protein